MQCVCVSEFVTATKYDDNSSVRSNVLFKYKPGDHVGSLEDWPFDNPASDYQINEGEPKASGRFCQLNPAEAKAIARRNHLLISLDTSARRVGRYLACIASSNVSLTRAFTKLVESMAGDAITPGGFEPRVTVQPISLIIRELSD